MSQLIANALITAAIIALVAVGFQLIFQTARFFHFAHGVIITCGAYCAYWLTREGTPFTAALILSVLFCAALGSAIWVFTYRPLQARGAGPTILLLASLGSYIVIQNVISLWFGNDTKTIRQGVVHEGLEILGARITPVQALTMLTSAVLIVGLHFFLQKTRIGNAMRAVANDPELAMISGIDSNRVFIGTFAIGSALAGVAGILMALDIDMNPQMGMNALLMGVVAVIIGGVNSIPGVALGALLLGMAQNFGVWKISSQWQDAIAFIILLAFLLFRPQGFMGKKVKKATI